MNERFLELIENSIKDYWDFPALTDHKGKTFYYKDLPVEIAKLHIIFKHAGIRKGDKIALMGRNSSRWAISFFGVLAYGAVIVPVLNDFTPDDAHNIINHSEAKLFFVSNSTWEHLDQSAMPDVACFISLDDFSIIHARQSEIVGIGEQIESLFSEQYPDGMKPEQVQFHHEDPDELAQLNYTSGTTGFSKGVMLPYRSLWSNTVFAADNIPFVHAGDNFVCILPMAHTYGLAFEILNGINKGCHINFLPRVPNPKSIIESFAVARPTLIIAVPLIIEKIVKNNIFPVLEKPKMKILYKIPLLKQIIKKKILAQLNNAFGGNFIEIVLGGAPLNHEIEVFLRSIGFHYTVGYGMTECGPLIAYAQWDSFKLGSVGRKIDRMEIKIDSNDPERETGEILFGV